MNWYKTKQWLLCGWYLFLCAVMIAVICWIVGGIGLAFYQGAQEGPVQIVEKDGHKYAVVQTLRAVSMTHAPSCPCLQTNK